MSRRREAAPLDLSSWPEFDASAISAAKRKTFIARRQALEMYSQHARIGDIEDQTGVDRTQLYRLLNRCARTHDDGRIYGYRALVPYSRVTPYERVARLRLFPLGGSRGTALCDQGVRDGRA